MNLYILRHASAGTRRKNPLIDVKRPLDKEGKQQCILVAAYLNALDVQFDLIASSPLKRALQTASLVGTELGYDQKINVTDALSPEANVAKFQEFVASLQKHENVLLVGHNPNLPQFLGSLIASPGRASIRLRKGAIARVDYTRRPGTLNWLVDPRILRGVYTRVTKRSLRKTSLK
ncbi:MAG TPA: phosphohistidine phosphatase SixA [Pseudacidobacterium sp.]|jgi:phosphohistidine phosphatase|nr:phosphohistidine phosphatase SixA [Pseudacidobacterium sp.]